MIFYFFTLINTKEYFYNTFPILLKKGLIDIVSHWKDKKTFKEEISFRIKIKDYVKESKKEIENCRKSKDVDYNSFFDDNNTRSIAVLILVEFEKFIEFLKHLTTEEDSYQFYKINCVMFENHVKMCFSMSLIYKPNELYNISSKFMKLDLPFIFENRNLEEDQF